MSKIISLKDFFEKKYELRFYQGELERLHEKLNRVRSEVALTEKIISMIRKEEIVEIDVIKLESST